MGIEVRTQRTLGFFTAAIWHCRTLVTHSPVPHDARLGLLSLSAVPSLRLKDRSGVHPATTCGRPQSGGEHASSSSWIGASGMKR